MTAVSILGQYVRDSSVLTSNDSPQLATSSPLAAACFIAIRDLVCERERESVLVCGCKCLCVKMCVCEGREREGGSGCVSERV